jgi:hypothetical protein
MKILQLWVQLQVRLVVWRKESFLAAFFYHSLLMSHSHMSELQTYIQCPVAMLAGTVKQGVFLAG